MKDPSEDIRQWLYDILNLTVSYSGVHVPCYSFAPVNSTKPFIILGEQYMEADVSVKDKSITENSISIEIYAAYSGNDATYKLINSVANDIIQLVTADPITQAGSGGSSAGTIDNYDEIVISVQSISTQRVLFDNEIVIMKSIIIKFLLEEN